MTSTSISMRRVLPILPLTLFASGCEAIEGIFKAGVWTGVLLVVIGLAVVGFVISRVRSS